MIPDAHISKQDAIAAISEFRAAHKLISALQKQAMDRWSAGEDFAYTDEELANYKAARDHLLRSLERNPFNPTVHWLLANAYGEIDDDTSKLMKYYNSSLELDPNDDDVLVARMGMHMKAGRFGDAQRDLIRLQQLGSSHAGPMAEHLRKAKDNGEPADARESPS
ncbi:hypothetical protein LOC67_22525 [Stieleria sp. JC731]|uniref:hypothetical protein n=1 Tax=Stieleria sp. JC731 TaxID=2894195 RepID=UPI001E5998E9|nr:hypothetical protein [Stieleria sp. JC731]MCC9603335.1 hypothetical protein [Stieleria sp. JC731]